MSYYRESYRPYEATNSRRKIKKLKKERMSLSQTEDLDVFRLISLTAWLLMTIETLLLRLLHPNGDLMP